MTVKAAIFDLETRENPAEVGWKNYQAMGISLGCAYLEREQEWRIYGEENAEAMALDLLGADVVVGFNIVQFDLPLLRATAERVNPALVSLCTWADMWDKIGAKTYDVLEDIRDALGTPYAKGWKLDQVAQANLTVRKNGDGADAPGLWRAGRLAELATYVIQDVKVERALWDHVLATGRLTNPAAGVETLELRKIREYST